jgi:hypothetical protein
VVSVLYLRTLVVMSSLLTSAYQTGLFATSYRILEMIVVVPGLMVGTAFPIMSRVELDDLARLRYIIQRLIETSLLVGVLLVLVLMMAAEPIVVILGEHAYKGAAPVLQINRSRYWDPSSPSLDDRAGRGQAPVRPPSHQPVAGQRGVTGGSPSLRHKGAAAAAVAGKPFLHRRASDALRAQPQLRPISASRRNSAVRRWRQPSAHSSPIFRRSPGRLAVAVYTLVRSIKAVPQEVFDALSRRAPRPS